MASPFPGMDPFLEHPDIFPDLHERFNTHLSETLQASLVTTIEILSLANKTPGEHGRDLYLREQREVLGSKVHLVEIDLLRGGEHSTAVPLDLAHTEAVRGRKVDGVFLRGSGRLVSGAADKRLQVGTT